MSKRGMTLIELIVASMLVGIVILGIVGVESSIRRSRNQGIMQMHNVMNLTKAMLHLKRDAQAVIGKDVTDNWSVAVHELYLGANKEHDIYIIDADFVSVYHLGIALRQPGDDADGTSDDYYVVYYVHYRNTTPPYYLLRDRCSLIEDCWSYGSEMSMADGTGEVIAELNDIDGVEGFFDYAITDNKLEYLEFKLSTLADNEKDFDPILNPRYELRTRISPAGLSR